MTTETAAKKDTQKLQRAIVDGLEDVKGHDIQVFDTEHLSPLFERVIVASGTSNRQTRALASSVIDAVREAGFPKPRIEGEDNGEWIIVDCGAAVAHIMQPAIRQYYHLEEIWGEKPIRLRLGASKPATPEREPVPAKKVPTSLRRSSAAKTAEREAKQAAETAKKRPAKKAPPRSAGGRTAAKAPAKTAAHTPVKTGAVSTARTAAGKAALKAPAKTAAKKAPVKTAPVKTAAKKTPTRA